MSSPTMMPMSLTEIAQAVDGRLMPTTMPTDEPVAISAFTDSRQIVPGSVFVAIAGERVDGHDFVPKVGAQGAVAALVDHEIAGAQVPQIVVEKHRQGVGSARQHNIERRRALESPFTVIGITGSVGKTTTKDLLKSLLSKMGDTVAPVGSFNNEIGLPLTSLKVNADTRFLVAEMGANHVGEIANLTSLVPPDIAVVLKVGVAHLGEFGSAERIAQSQIGNRTRTGAGRPDHPQRQRRTCGRDERHRSGRCAVVRPAAEKKTRNWTRPRSTCAATISTIRHSYWKTRQAGTPTSRSASADSTTS